MQRKKRQTILLILTGLLVFALVWATLLFLPKSNTGYRLKVPAGYGISGVSRNLSANDVIYSRWVFVGTAYMLGMGDKIHRGNYRIPRSVSSWQILQKLRNGKPDSITVQIIEGSTFAQMRRLIDNTPDIEHITKDWSDSKLLQQLNAESNYTQAEGLFFPATYDISSDSSDLSLYQQAFNTMQRHLQAAWEERRSDLPYQSAYDLLIMASLIEKETGHAEDRNNVAAVFVNRLNQHMRLQTDPTVIYGMGSRYKGKIGKADLRRDTPYNTYTRSGLPPTPIALPGKAALEAAAHPASNNYLYFVARNDGTGRSQFSHNLNEHNAAVRQYILKKH
ncbi:aminodeoxychorismate lyase [Snodgrassella alvi]|uniref:Endolytic murein transglycosylase n=1 Tax=Snodgrassella alvi TaxID=1196083 RepID=A0A2N9Y3B9_9NEIS|nr:endolytic transglycosylase MltG [Snodgrassella alvi]PIT61956.1 aminodeoxychorismate lyase [Snodgrassella alvi]PIT66169.1 aminodeoxychorismate lyase [Snodgrassella alvi]